MGGGEKWGAREGGEDLGWAQGRQVEGGAETEEVSIEYILDIVIYLSKK